ncbi:uncharacterized protein Eint_040180 [Encephalitozoon intestinalis ATCC 50506]|uniref:Protein kinase domain-containing protein n=1 Tax=Encephalitozoon intestinalis (strain ATCC 50506) TaxID=876142 RepID=E0S6H4_ENCIT|nr:uncharacterized protein Eint_040180 [Encephalitozoon intestinalis ATCC 50506]ADM11309.1 hypothetical protein Eint_040180 [Encephalitozoon intestinalis ATCC 50506]UTX44995.1 putative Mad3/BUB1 like region 1 protein [Encephalitozoon intestinalis]
MVAFGDICEDEIEAFLLSHIDIPYFRNNPSYISLWQRYYYKTKEPGVLFLMKYKKVSQYYHWIYVELSRLFMKNGHYGISRAILDMGIACNAYDKKVLKDEIEKIPLSTTVFSDHETSALINPKGFVALGKVWNSYRETLFYNRELFILDGEEISFEEYRSRIWSKKTALSCPRVSHRVETDVPSREEHSLNNKTRILSRGSCRIHNQDGRKRENNSAEVTENILASGQEIIIDDLIYYIKEVIDEKRYRMICISNEVSKDLMNRGDLLLHEVSKTTIDLIQKLDSNYVPPFNVKKLGSRMFLLYDFYYFGSLKSCLDVPTSIRSNIALYFMAQLADIFNEMKKVGLGFTSFSLESLCVSEDCRLKIVDFDWSLESPEINYGEIMRDFLQQYTNFPTDAPDITEKIRSELEKIKLKELIVKYKIHIYEKICKYP